MTLNVLCNVLSLTDTVVSVTPLPFTSRTDFNISRPELRLPDSVQYTP